MVRIFDEKGPVSYLNLCSELLKQNIVGNRIVWANCYYGDDIGLMIKKISSNDRELIDYLNHYEKFHSSFSGLFFIFF